MLEKLLLAMQKLELDGKGMREYLIPKRVNPDLVEKLVQAKQIMTLL